MLITGMDLGHIRQIFRVDFNEGEGDSSEPVYSREMHSGRDWARAHARGTVCETQDMHDTK
jgi:hypothetical protein